MIADSLPPPAPAMDDPRYLVEDPRAIRLLLEDLSKRATPLTIQPEGSDIVSPSLVLSFEPGTSVELDGSNVAAVNACISRSHRLYCFAELDKVQVRFVLDNPVIAHAGASTRFVTNWPSRVFHHQRRELFRLQTPLKDSPTLLFESGEPASPMAMRICDISIGGIGLQHQLDPAHLALGTVLEDASIRFQEETLSRLTLKVVNERTVTLPDGRTVRRTGLAFTGLPAAAQNSVSRYIFGIERQRNARRNGKD